MTHETILQLAAAVLLLPLASFAVLIFFNNRLPKDGSVIGTALLFVLLAMSSVILFAKLMWFHEETIQYTFTWINLGAAFSVIPDTIELGIMVDNLAAIMLVVVTIVSSLVHLFSLQYMKGDVRFGRYYAYLSLFTFSMLMIVLTNNFLTMYVGWELVGLSSYLLIGHWFEKKSAADASKKAFIVNRVGDVGMFAGILILYTTFHTFSFDAIFGAMKMGELPYGSEAWLTAAGILIFCGAIGKSAQFPLHVWLPDAMEGPTPVSALIHAATMVAAGVYLVARTYVMMTADALAVIAHIGVITAFIAATIAIAQNDIKKVLAYSTISQLGYMIMGLGVGAYSAGFFHLTTHAMFKAGLFLGSGSVIHAMHHALHHQHDHHTDAQDIRNMGGLRTVMPITYIAFLIYTLAISGIPGTSGFMSKDEILAGTLAYGSLTGNYIIAGFAFLTAGMTAFYMFRLVILTFHGNHVDSTRTTHLHESPWEMTTPLVIFAVLSIFIFFSFNPFKGADGWLVKAVERPETAVPEAVAAPNAAHFEEVVEHVSVPAMALSVTVALIGIGLAFATYQYKKINADAIAAKMPRLHKFLLNKWYFDELYDFTAVNGLLLITRMMKWFDNTIIDGLVNGTARWTAAATLGVKWAWEERRWSARIYMLAALLVSIYAGYSLAAWSMPVTPVWSSYLWHGLLGVFIAGMTFFLFYTGVGGFDHSIVDGMVNGVASFAGLVGLFVRRVQTGRVQTYIAFVLLGVVIFFLWFR